MASAQRAPRDVLLQADADYRRLAEQHRQYDLELQRISKSPYLNAEDLLEEIKLRSEEHTSELQSHSDLVCRLLLEKKKKKHKKDKIRIQKQKDKDKQI